MTVCNLPFAIGAHLDHFLVDDDVVDLDLRPPDSEAQRHVLKVQVNMWQDLPPPKLDTSHCLHFKIMLTGHNIVAP